jgi:hypothetical protein
MMAKDKVLIANAGFKQFFTRRYDVPAVRAHGATLFGFIIRLVLSGEVGEGII